MKKIFIIFLLSIGLLKNAFALDSNKPVWDQVDNFEVNFMKKRDQVWIRSAILELDNGNLGSGLVKSLAIL